MGAFLTQEIAAILGDTEFDFGPGGEGTIDITDAQGNVLHSFEATPHGARTIQRQITGTRPEGSAIPCDIL